MWGLIIGVTLGGMLLMLGIGAWRDGSIALGERRLERGQIGYALVTAALITAGAGLAAASVVLGWRVEHGPPQPVEHDGITLTLPPSWQADPDLAEMLSQGGMRAAAWHGSGDELLLTWPAEPQANIDDLDLAIASLEDASIRYTRWEIRKGDGARRVDMEYPSPRGDVVAAVIAQRVAGGVRLVTAMCSHQGDPSRCRRAIASLEVR